MSYATQQAHAGYSISPTVEEVDQDLRELRDSTLESYASGFDPAQIQSKSWEVLPTEQRKAIRAKNELARRKHAKERADAKAAEAKRIEAAANAANQAKIDAFKVQMRGAWIGDQQSFDAAFPEMLRQWQVDTARATNDRSMAEARARIGGF